MSQSNPYTVRVVNSTVSSARTGWVNTLLPVQTFRTQAVAGVLGSVTNYVGGENPALVDAAANAGTATLASLTTGSTAPQSLASIAVTTADIAGIDFGFNFSTIVSTRDTGQGSLRQAITNANTLGSDNLLAQSGRTAAVENIVFMISNGTAGSGLRSSLNYFSSGIATIAPTSALPTISTTMIVDARTQPGWTSAPVIELNGTSAGVSTVGLNLTASNSTLAGFIITRFNGAGIAIATGTGNTVAANYIGTSSAGSAASANAGGGITVASASNTIGGNTSASRNVISGNTGAGIAVASGGNTTTIRANVIGLNAAGTAALANSGDGISITTATGALIGGATSGMGNVIGGNGGNAITLTATSGASVLGNTLGLQGDGLTLLATPGNGILASAATSTTIGGIAAGAGNTIRLATAKAIVVTGASNVTIRGNSISGSTGLGLDLAGDGITANDGAKTTGQPNLLMDSPVYTSARARGNQLTVAGYVGSAANQAAFGSATVDFYVSDAASANGSGKTWLGTLTADANGNFSGTVTMPVSVLAIGTRLTGTATDGAGNTSEFGVDFTGLVVDLVVNDNGDAADANPGDGLCATAGGVCTLRAAIGEVNSSAAQSSAPTVAFALPGCSAAGQAACTITPASGLPALSMPMAIDAQTQAAWTLAPIVELRGTSAGSVHGITVSAAGSAVRGLTIGGFGAAGTYAGIFVDASNTTIEGNYIGVTADGNTARPNGSNNSGSGGVYINGGTGIVIGGATAAKRNVLSGNGGAGIWINAGTATILGNYIGTNAAGTVAISNGRWGMVLLSGASQVQIGGAAAGAGNVISGNTTNAAGGIWLDGSSHTVQGNTIGLSANQAVALANGSVGSVYSSGIYVTGGSHTIGGSNAGEGNTIAGNVGDGVRVMASTTAARLLGNSIYNNTALGIDLAGNGVTANTGVFNGSRPNNGMNHPVVNGAGVNPSQTALTVSGHIGTGSGQAVFAGARVEIFGAAVDPSGYGEGRVYLGFLTADANGRFSGSVSFAPGLVSVGDPITATATDTAGNTSEFGPNWTSTTLAALAPAGFNAFDADTAAGALTGVLRSKTAGAASNIAVIALDNSGSALHAGFTGSVTLNWLDARDDSGANAGSCRASWVDMGSAGTAVFSNANRVNVALTPPATATRSMRLRMTFTGPSGTVVACSGDNFAALPAQLAWGMGGGGAGSHGATDTNSASPGTTRALDNTAASGGVVHQAGQPFTLRARALDAGGEFMPAYDGSPVLTIAGCLLPSGCSPGALSGTTAAAVGGVYTNNAVSYSEVGAIAVQLSDSDYGSVDSADTAALARTVASSALSVGRFVPDSYSAVVSSNGQFATANVSCMAPGSAATFIGQPFAWSVTPQVTVTARNAAGAATQLWTGTLMKLDASSGMNATLNASGTGTATLNRTPGPLAVQGLGNGQARISASALDRFALDAAAPQASVSPSWQWQLAFIDSSEAGTPGNPQPGASASQAVLFNQGGS
ncbi:MAG: beta strand repeat-containing protein, partial [Rubrivivax sp.]